MPNSEMQSSGSGSADSHVTMVEAATEAYHKLHPQASAPCSCCPEGVEIAAEPANNAEDTAYLRVVSLLAPIRLERNQGKEIEISDVSDKTFECLQNDDDWKSMRYVFHSLVQALH